MEGSKPNAKDEKEIADASKISNNLHKIFLNIVKDNAKCRRWLPKSLAIFGGKTFDLQFMAYFGMTLLASHHYCFYIIFTHYITNENSCLGVLVSSGKSWLILERLLQTFLMDL